MIAATKIALLQSKYAHRGKRNVMKILHVSDLHIGKRVNGISMVEDQKYILGQIVAIAKEQRVGAILISGDIYDKASPSAEAVTVLDSFLSNLTSAGIRVLAVPGNHDSAERIAYAQGLLAAQGVCFPPVFTGAIQKVELEDEYGLIHFWLLPFLRPGDVRRFFPEIEIGDDYSAALKAVLGTCDLNRSCRNIVLTHQLVTAAGKSPDRADDEIKLGGIDNVDVSIYDQFDYVALGHVHRPQRVGRDTVRYAGSPLKYSFSEARYPKSAVLVDVGSKSRDDEVGACISFELIPLKPLHDMREVCMRLDDLLAQRSNLGAEANDYLHVTLTDEHPQLDAMAKIRDLFPNTMAVDYNNVTLAMRRERVRTAVDPDKVDTVELFERFYEEQVEKPVDDVQHEIVSKVVSAAEEASSRGLDGKGNAR